MKTITIVNGERFYAGPVLDLDLPENKAITAVSADVRAHYSEGTFVIQCATWDSAETWSDLATVILPPHEEGTIRAEVTAELRENRELVRWAVRSTGGGTYYVNYKTEEGTE